MIHQILIFVIFGTHKPPKPFTKYIPYPILDSENKLKKGIHQHLNSPILCATTVIRDRIPCIMYNYGPHTVHYVYRTGKHISWFKKFVNHFFVFLKVAFGTISWLNPHFLPLNVCFSPFLILKVRFCTISWCLTRNCITKYIYQYGNNNNNWYATRGIYAWILHPPDSRGLVQEPCTRHYQVCVHWPYSFL